MADAFARLECAAGRLGSDVTSTGSRVTVTTAFGRTVTLDRLATTIAIAVSSPRPHAGAFLVRRAVHWSSPQASSRVRTGDVRFDGVLSCHGDPEDVHTLLGPDERRLVAALFEAHPALRFLVAPRRVRVHVADCLDTSSIVDVVRRLEALSDIMTVRADGLFGRLLAKALDDRAPRARSIAVELLLARVIPFSTAERIVCEQLARSDTLPSRLRVDAMIRLRRHPPDDTRATMQSLLFSLEPTVVANAVRFAAEDDDFDALDAIVRCATSADAEVRRAAAWALGRFGGDAAEVALIHLAPTTREAVEALGFVGGFRAVAALEPLTRGVRRSATSKRVARRAVRLIKKRVGPAGRGRLAIVYDAGALSSVDAASS
ncbi:MAG: HEAT repeat domain-containing protein [Deltaproteobacteria bacterium]|jgi:hypothetical protein